MAMARSTMGRNCLGRRRGTGSPSWRLTTKMATGSWIPGIQSSTNFASSCVTSSRPSWLRSGNAAWGAIYTGSAPTPFEIKNDENELLGIVKESGIYIGENGNAGTIQQVDLVA